jgi:hypothetical protein
MSYLCYRSMAICVLDLPGAIVHNNLYTRRTRNVGSCAQEEDRMSDWTYSLVFADSNVFF